MTSAAKDHRPLKADPLCPEHQLLLACAAPLSPARRAEIEALIDGGLDWQLVLTAARAQRVVAFCYPVLQQLGRQSMPAEVLAAFRAQATAIAARNLRVAAKLLEITARGEASQVPLVPYKGPVLAEMAYGNLGLREFVDLDFILPHRDLPAARRLLESLGYRLSSAQLAAPGAPVPGEYVFLSAERDVPIELHTELTLRHFPSPPDLEPLLAARRPVALLGHPVLTFSREDTLPLLAVHGAKDLWAELLWICDIAHLVESPDFDWRKALDRAGRMQCRRMTNVALLLAGEIPGAVIPERILAAAQADAPACAQSRWIAGRLFASGPIGRREQFRYRARMVEGFWPGLRYVVRLATTPAADDWNALHLPAPLGFAYALLRPLRLFRR